jgi:cation:H+ antiporter
MKSVIIIILGFFLLIKGADILVNGSSGIAKKFHIPEIIVGLTIVSIGTSLPELMISVKSAISGYADISIGSVLGSCICNTLLILGASSIFALIPIDSESKNVVLPLSILAMLVILIFGNIDMQISRMDGLILLGILGIFMIYIGSEYLKIKDEVQDENSKKDSKDEHLIKNIIQIILGIIGLKFGGDFVVDEAENLARAFGISESIIGLTIVAIGTSLPELVTSIVAGKTGKGSIAFGNAIGSNLFNLVLVLGTSATITPINYSIDFNFTLTILILTNLLIWIFDQSGKKHFLTKLKGLSLLLIYAEYMIALIF